MMKLSISLSFLLPIILEETNASDPYWYWYSTPEEIESYRNGVVSTLACPLGTYRDFGDRKTRRHGGIGVEGCIPCPKGRYGSSNDLTSSYCTGACPVGTYLDKTGGKSRHDCKPCPVGTFGDTEGLTTKECSGFCSDLNTVKTKYYGRDEGLTSRNGCIKCSDGYLDPRGQCNNVHDVIMQYMRKN